MFTIDVNESDILRFSYIGMESGEFSVEEINMELNGIIVMDVSIYLQEVVIVATYPTNSYSTTTCYCCGQGVTAPETLDSIKLSLHTSFEYAPNPTTNVVWVRSEGVMGDIWLFSSTGALLNKVKTNENETRVDLSPYPAGTYFLHFEGQGYHTFIGKVLRVKS